MIDEHVNDLLESKPKLKFQELSAKNVKNMKLLKKNQFFSIFTAEYEDLEVYVVNYNYVEYSDLQAMKRTKFSKLKSKFILNRLGYLIDKNKFTLSLVYEYSPGHILSFEDFINTANESDKNAVLLENARKLNIFDKIMHVMKRLLDTNIQLGLMHPNLFIYNPNSTITPIIMIEFSLSRLMKNYIGTSAQNRLYFGLFDFDSKTIEFHDELMIFVFASKCLFAYPVYDYSFVLNKFYKEFKPYRKDRLKDHEQNEKDYSNEVNYFNYLISINKEQYTNKKGDNNGEILDDVTDVIEIFFKQQVRKLKEKLKEVSKDKSDEKHEATSEFFDDFAVFYNDFFKQIHCKNCLKSKDANVTLYPICLEPLCCSCYRNHNCTIKNVNTFEIMKKNNSNYKKKLERTNKNIEQNFTSLDADFGKNFVCNTNTMAKNENFLYNEILPMFDQIKLEQSSSKEFFESKNKILMELFDSCRQKIKNIQEGLEEELNQLETELKEANDDVLVSKEELYEKKIKELTTSILNLRQLILKSNSNNDLFYSIKNLADLAQKNETIMHFYRKNSIENIYYDLTKSLFNNLKSFKIQNEDKFFLTEFYTLEKNRQVETQYSEIFAPIFQTKSINKLTQLFSLKPTIFNQPLELKFKFFLPKMKWAAFENIILFTGGFNVDMSKSVNSAYIYNTYAQNLNELTFRQNMKYDRDSHAIAVFNQIFFIVVGGSNSDTVEKYSLIRDEWEELPKINQVRADSTLYVHNKFLIYCFGGVNDDGNFISTIEQLDLGVAYTKEFWQEIQFKNPDGLLLEKSNMGVLKIKKNNILLFGGKFIDKDYGTETYSNEVINFDFSSKTFTKNNHKIGVKGYFHETQFLLLDSISSNKTYAQFVYNDTSMSSLDDIPHLEKYTIDSSA